MKTIFIIDDDVAIGDMVETVLKKNGYDCVRAFSGTEAVLRLNDSAFRPDLILLDLMLPGLTGEEVLPKIKEITNNTSVIVVSAKIDVDSKINMLMDGAVDYLTKPFDIRELLVRIELHIKMAQAVASGSGTGSGAGEQVVFDDIVIDVDSYKVTVGGEQVNLTKTEFAILKLLMTNSKTVVTKSTIIDRISAETEDCTESSLKTHMSHVRGKLKAVSGKDYIESVWGIGFKMNSNLN